MLVFVLGDEAMLDRSHIMKRVSLVHVCLYALILPLWQPYLSDITVLWFTNTLTPSVLHTLAIPYMLIMQRYDFPSKSPLGELKCKKCLV